MMRVLALVACLLVASRAYAEDAIVRGSVVKIEAQEIYVSIGSSKGVQPGAALRIKRPISLRHPVTRATVQDWIPIGSANVTQSGEMMSRAVVGELVSEVKVGDIAEVLVDRPDAQVPASAQPPPQAAPPVPEGPPIDPETAEVLGVFSAQSGQSLDARIAAWERFLSMRASSPYAPGIRRDLDELHQLRDELRPRNAAAATETIVEVEHNPPKRATSGAQVPLVFVLERPDDIASAYLHYRPRGNRTYRSMLLVREHDIYLRGTLPAEVVKTPGVDYFVEVSTPAGRSGLAIGTPRDPVAVDVAEPTILDRFGSTPGRSSVKLAIDYLDFATFDKRNDGDHTDQMVTANIDFTYSLSSIVESLGVGYGVYAGSGGDANAVWDPSMNPIPRAGFHYGYADIEIGGRTDGVHVSGGGALIAGVGKTGFGMGGEGRLRIGDRDNTNLAFIARSIAEVGFLTDIRFAAKPTNALLLGISVGATNQPNERDVGVKLGTDVEIVAIKNMSIILRGSWQGRSTAHGGIGGGGGLGFYW